MWISHTGGASAGEAASTAGDGGWLR